MTCHRFLSRTGAEGRSEKESGDRSPHSTEQTLWFRVAEQMAGGPAAALD